MARLPDLPDGNKWYNGSTITSVPDFEENVFMAGNFTDPDGNFRFGVWRYGKDGSIRRMALKDDALNPAARGSIYLNAYLGRAYYTVGLGSSSRCRAEVPEFVKFPTSNVVDDVSWQPRLSTLETQNQEQTQQIVALTQRVADLEAKLSGVSGSAKCPNCSVDLVLVKK